MLKSPKRESDEPYYKYVIAQVAGGTLAGLFTAYLQGSGANLAALSPAEGLTLAQVFLMEFFYSIPITLTACHISDSRSYGHLTPTIKGLLISSCVFIAGVAIGSSTGGCINPSIAVSLTLARFVSSGDNINLAKLLVYVLAPLCASFVSHNIFQSFILPNLDDSIEAKSSEGDYIQMEDLEKSTTKK